MQFQSPSDRRALAIAAFYVDPDYWKPFVLPASEIAWAFRQYQDPSLAVSLRSLSEQLGVNRMYLYDKFREYDGYTYAKVAQRRAPGGDLYYRHWGNRRR